MKHHIDPDTVDDYVAPVPQNGNDDGEGEPNLDNDQPNFRPIRDTNRRKAIRIR